MSQPPTPLPGSGSGSLVCIAADSGTLGLSQNPPRRSLDTPVIHPLQLDIGKRRAAGGHRQNGMHQQPLSPTPACLYHPGPGASPTTLHPLLPPGVLDPELFLKFTFQDFAISLVNKFNQLITMESNSWLLYPKGQSSELPRLLQGPPAAGASFKLSEPLPQASPLESSYSFSSLALCCVSTSPGQSQYWEAILPLPWTLRDCTLCSWRQLAPTYPPLLLPQFCELASCL